MLSLGQSYIFRINIIGMESMILRITITINWENDGRKLYDINVTNSNKTDHMLNEEYTRDIDEVSLCVQSLFKRAREMGYTLYKTIIYAEENL